MSVPYGLPETIPAARLRTDPIEIEIFAKQFAAIAEQMAITVAKTLKIGRTSVYRALAE